MSLALVAKTLFVFALVVGALLPLLAWVEQRRAVLLQEKLALGSATGARPSLRGLAASLSGLSRVLLTEAAVPTGAHRVLHLLAPALVALPALMVFALIPFAGVYVLPSGRVSMAVAEPDWGILFVFMAGALATYATVMTGWASNDSTSLLGSLRASLQVLSYQAGLGLSAVALLMVYGTLQLQEMVLAQDGTFRVFALIGALGVTLPDSLQRFPFVLPAWGLFVQPLAFALFLTCALAQSRRPPFDAQVEVAAPPPATGLLRLAELVQVVVIAAIVATLFLGGWSLPFLPGDVLVAALTGSLGVGTGTVLAALIQLAAFLLKLGVVIALQLAIRWSLPRLRYDEVMDLCWKMVVPLALANLLATGIAVLLLGGTA